MCEYCFNVKEVKMPKVKKTRVRGYLKSVSGRRAKVRVKPQLRKLPKKKVAKKKASRVRGYLRKVSGRRAKIRVKPQLRKLPKKKATRKKS
jgi:ribosome-binding factor A